MQLHELVHQHGGEGVGTEQGGHVLWRDGGTGEGEGERGGGGEGEGEEGGGGSCVAFSCEVEIKFSENPSFGYIFSNVI